MTDEIETVLRSRIVGEAEVAPGSLASHPLNWRKHSKRQLEAIEQQLALVGWVQRVIVNKRSGVLIDGHARVEIARRRGEATIPVEYVDLDRDEEALVLATLDPLGAMADRDQVLLEATLAELPALPAGELSDMLALLGVDIDDPQPVTFSARPRATPQAITIRVPLTMRSWSTAEIGSLAGTTLEVSVDVEGEETKVVAGELSTVIKDGGAVLELRATLPYTAPVRRRKRAAP